MLPGRPEPPIATLLGGRLLALDTTAGTLAAEYEATDAFLNPAGTVQGGMLAAMLDDLCAAVVDARAGEGGGVVTLTLNLSFLAPARPGRLQGRSSIVGGGRSICYVEAVLAQAGTEVARATACCRVIGARKG
ncbi:PaaI family thioesterase [uncultured Pseudacidovorax sp.]|uniref:PaaI family thioesterase n=1 Tax=uncultured Pseudacidovorax sp. TaxID=679313 RepID=UPI0025D93CEE|nr:PaaI family thioesterase [uncultured Pseudacidovorax sp.]